MSNLVETTIGGITAYFVKSENIKIFPCAYRGYYVDVEGETPVVFDPEARANTEANYVNLYGKRGASGDSYIISYTEEGILTCIVGGYYVQIKNISADDFKGLTAEDPLTIVLNLEDITLSDTLEDGLRKTATIQSLYDTSNYLDTKITGDTTQYIFTGLAIIKSSDAGDYGVQLTPFVQDPDGDMVADWSKYTLDDVLATGSGRFSLKTRGAESDEYESHAEGDYSVAFGRATLAAGDSSIALGTSTVASGDNSLVNGDSSEAKALNSVAFGKNVTTHSARTEQVVIGRYNIEKDAMAFIIGNGTSGVGNTKNIFEVADDGSVSMKGKLELAGNITAMGGTSGNNLILGSTTTNDYGSLTIYGATNTIVFSINNAGNTTIKGTVSATGDVEALADVNISGDLNVTADAAITGVLTVTGKTTLNDELDVTTKKATLRAGLDVIGATDLDGEITGSQSLQLSGVTADAETIHALTLGSATTKDTGSITIWGANYNTKVFTVTKTGAITTRDDFSNFAAGKSVLTKKLGLSAECELDYATTGDWTGMAYLSSGLRVNGDLSISGIITANGLITAQNNFDNLSANKAVLTKKLILSGTAETPVCSLEYIIGDTAAKLISDLQIMGDLYIAGSSLILQDGSTTAISVTKDAVSISGTLTVAQGIAGPVVTGTSLNGSTLTLKNSINETRYSITDLGGVTQSGSLTIKNGVAGDTTFNVVANTGNVTAAGTIGAAHFSTGDTGTITAFSAEIGNSLTQAGGITCHGGALIKNGLSIYNGLNVATGGMIITTGQLLVNSTLAGTPVIKAPNGYIEAAWFNATSDVRKKCAIGEYSCKNSILDLPVREFEFIDDSTHTKHIGCIAQELQLICPEIVHEDSEGYLSIEENKLVYLLLQEVKELKMEVKKLKGE